MPINKNTFLGEFYLKIEAGRKNIILSYLFWNPSICISIFILHITSNGKNTNFLPIEAHKIMAHILCKVSFLSTSPFYRPLSIKGPNHFVYRSTKLQFSLHSLLCQYSLVPNWTKIERVHVYMYIISGQGRKISALICIISGRQGRKSRGVHVEPTRKAPMPILD